MQKPEYSNPIVSKHFQILIKKGKEKTVQICRINLQKIKLIKKTVDIQISSTSPLDLNLSNEQTFCA
ncbi:hypothetical protein BpHYR1_020383 [Brachionus plicatilis]|uniref:Uncharacterized protein n=1 Tax=Brachionus plicatilis TaxID=10195 RepID=A0A3M7QX17_BRAPC|nr:hypothetical protein BpHYR1_020383 [Brachionus plicatilis]